MAVKPAVLTLGLLLVLSPLAACASPGEPTAAPASVAPASPSAPMPATSPAVPGPSPATTTPGLSRTPLPTLTGGGDTLKTPSNTYDEITVTGTIRITGACVGLATDSGLWSLLGAQTFTAGQTVKVVGRPEPQSEQPCDGGPLRVRTATVVR